MVGREGIFALKGAGLLPRQKRGEGLRPGEKTGAEREGGPVCLRREGLLSLRKKPGQAR